MAFNNHGFYFGLQLHTSVLSWLRYSDCFSKLVHFLSEPTNVRYSVNLEIELSVFVLLDGTYLSLIHICMARIISTHTITLVISWPSNTYLMLC